MLKNINCKHSIFSQPILFKRCFIILNNFLCKNTIFENQFLSSACFSNSDFVISGKKQNNSSRGHIFSCVRPFCERAVSDLDPQRYIHRPVQVAHSSFIGGSHTTKNTDSDHLALEKKSFEPKQRGPPFLVLV